LVFSGAHENDNMIRNVRDMDSADKGRRVESEELGSVIRMSRRSRQLTVEALAQRAKISKSAVSQIERGRIEPSLHTLRRIASALGVPLATFFQTGVTRDRGVVRRGERRILQTRDDRLRYELLTSDLINKRVEFLRVEMDPGDRPNRELYSHGGEEYNFIIHGVVEFTVDGVAHTLRAGDSIYFDGSRPHYVRNGGRTKAELICAISPPRY
jgi:transcriptional regulator with XRE-family HTH domain